MENKKKKDNHFLAFDNRFFKKNQKLLLVLFNLVYKLFPSLFFKSGERDDFKGNKIIEVSNSFATCDAGLQYFKKSSLIKTASENPENNHRARRIYRTIYRKMKQGKIKEELKLLPARKTVFFTDWNYSKMLYNAFKPMWWAMHYWDELVADRFVPTLSFGFDTLTQYPGSIGTDNPVDGVTSRHGQDATFASVQSGAGTYSTATTTSDWSADTTGSTTTNQFQRIMRGGFCYDTSALTAGATISAAVHSLYGISKTNGLGSPAFHLCGWTPANTNAIANGDYGTYGSTSFGNVSYASFVTGNYGDITLNASGLAAISKTGITGIGSRNEWDINASFTGTWDSNATSHFETYLSNYGSNKPKLVVTYSVGLPIQLNISDSWKQASSMQLNISDTWKTVTHVQINVGDTWRTIFSVAFLLSSMFKNFINKL